MKKSLYAAGAIVLAGFLVGSTLASPQRETLTVTTGSTSTALVAATNTIRGYIEEVVFDVPSAASTGNVSLATLSAITTEASQTLSSTDSICADTVMRPRWKADVYTGGGAQGTEYGIRFLMVGEQIVFAVTNATVTGAVWRCHVKFDDGK